MREVKQLKLNIVFKKPAQKIETKLHLKLQVKHTHPHHVEKHRAFLISFSVNRIKRITPDVDSCPESELTYSFPLPLVPHHSTIFTVHSDHCFLFCKLKYA
jgi:hypothetical protein